MRENNNILTLRTHTQCHTSTIIIISLPVPMCHWVVEPHVVSYSNGARSCRAIDAEHLFSALAPVAVVKVHPGASVSLAVRTAAKPVVSYASLQCNGASLTDICMEKFAYYERK